MGIFSIKSKQFYEAIFLSSDFSSFRLSNMFPREIGDF